jgi:hypothetical protein
VDPAASGTVRTHPGLHCHSQQGVQEKNPQEFSGELSTEIFTGRIRLPVENRCGIAAGRGLSPHLLNGPVASPLRHAEPMRDSTADRLRPASGLRYPSRVCSTTGAAIGRIAAAIDQLASDARGEGGEPRPGELAARVAELWLMVSALDPELARRKEHYTKPADGAPSP